MLFLCDAIDLKQSVQGTFKVLGKTLAAVLDKVYFIVNLYSFPLPLVSHENPSFPKVSHLPPSPSQAEQNNFQNPTCFSVNTSFSRISQLLGMNQQNVKRSWLLPLSFAISLKDTSFHISINSQGLYLLSRMIAEFSLKLLYSTMCGKSFWIYEVRIPRKCINSRHFNSCPTPTQNLRSNSCHHALGRRRLLIPPGSIFSKIYFHQQQERLEETMIQ